MQLEALLAVSFAERRQRGREQQEPKQSQRPGLFGNQSSAGLWGGGCPRVRREDRRVACTGSQRVRYDLTLRVHVPSRQCGLVRRTRACLLLFRRPPGSRGGLPCAKQHVIDTHDTWLGSPQPQHIRAERRFPSSSPSSVHVPYASHVNWSPCRPSRRHVAAQGDRWLRTGPYVARPLLLSLLIRSAALSLSLALLAVLSVSVCGRRGPRGRMFRTFVRYHRGRLQFRRFCWIS
jgi:hypothetical protein